MEGWVSEEDYEFQHIMDESEDKVFQGWLRWQVTHWAALEDVSSRARAMAAPQRLKVSLVAAKYSNNHDSLQMEPWVTTMAGVLASGSDRPWAKANIPKAEAVMETISMYITRQKWMQPWSKSIFYAFQNNKPINLPYAIHPEAALASLMKYVGGATEAETDRVTGLIQVMFCLGSHDIHQSDPTHRI
jgi:hypothetical protein